jgi:signal transduction histidine kinase
MKLMLQKFDSSENLPFLTIGILQKRLMWSIRLRWIAIISFFSASYFVFSFWDNELPYYSIWNTLMILAGINFTYFLLAKIMNEFSLLTELIMLAVHIVVDLIFLTLLVHLVGGAENPVYLFYIFHVVLSAIVFPRWIPWLIATLVVLLFSALTLAESFELIDHYCPFGVPHFHNSFFINVTLIAFTVTVYVTAYICTTFMKAYRKSKRIIDQQNRQLQAVNEEKMQFFRFASHELKSPIITIQSSIDGVISAYENSIEERAINILKRASARSKQMLEILKELLELSNTNPISENRKAAVEFVELIREIIEREGLGAEEKGIQISHKISLKSFEMAGKKEDFDKIFTNLINNAIRYTDKGGSINIQVKEENTHFVFSVADTGIGVAEQDKEKIFSEFYRSENAKKMVAYGTGLGLSLVKKIVEDYNGKIDVTSVLNEGTTFKVKFPVAPACI